MGKAGEVERVVGVRRRKQRRAGGVERTAGSGFGDVVEARGIEWVVGSAFGGRLEARDVGGIGWFACSVERPSIAAGRRDGGHPHGGRNVA